MIAELARNGSKIFLARPRRFGKSLLVSTFSSLFEFGLRDFAGLKIEKVWKDRLYDVVRLDFSEILEFHSSERFDEIFYRWLTDRFERIGFEPVPGRDILSQLSLWLETRTKEANPFVLLIDEYDAPLTACLDDSASFERVRAVLSAFYLTVKANEGCLRFFFMTGITKLSNTGIFSAFNNLTDISLTTDYSTILGYTAEEILLSFRSHLDRAAGILGMRSAEILQALAEHYDGYCFDPDGKNHVFTPWSVLSFLNSPRSGFINYWYRTGGRPSVLMKYLRGHRLADPSHYLEPKAVSLAELSASGQYDEISAETLLTQTGYLTIKGPLGAGYVALGYPNLEVSASMAQLYADELLRNATPLQSGVPFLAKILTEESAAAVIRQFNLVFNAIDYQRFPIRDEASCRAYLQVLLIGAAMMPTVENHSALGRSDLEVQAGTRHWVFEIKFARTGEDPALRLAEGLEQLKTRRYGLKIGSEELRRMALVFSEEQREFILWETMD